MRRSLSFFALSLTALSLTSSPSRAYINQVDGTVVPQTGRMQACLDRPGTGETTPGAVDAIADAEVLPEVYRPVRNASGNYRVVFNDIGEGAGFRNSFGWFWVGEDVTDPNNLHTIFGCRTYGSCGCPCATTRTITIDFEDEPGFAEGRGIGFWIRTPERLDGTRENGTFPGAAGCPDFNLGCDPSGTNVNDRCGGRLDTDNRIYFTSEALNDDGDFVHFLVYTSATREDTYYFGFEDLFRGGDNDYEDLLVRATGLVPLCNPMPETCDGEDQDCDGMTDEGLEIACSTRCEEGVRVCTDGSYGTCSARVPAASETACDGEDEDCDGRTDEGLSRACSNMCGSGTEICRDGSYADCSAPVPEIESCNGDDDDCDGMTDEDLSRACSSACGSGVEMCSGGSYSGCTAPEPTAETCDGTDQDCDGRTDEGPITRACSSACGEGIETCIAGDFVGCTARAPGLEICNNVDDDCDGEIDEELSRSCSSACGLGTETCSEGEWSACDAPTPEEEVCNNIDDDCNGIIDDGNPGGGEQCIPDGMGGYTLDVPEDDLCTPGSVQCVAGELLCLGATSPSREICNCEDDDCDGEIDEDPDGSLCEGGACIECQCLTPCRDNEFPCPAGRECDRSLSVPEEGIPGYCVAGECTDVECGESEICDPATGECRDLCADIECSAGQACVRGRCVEDNCYGRGCEAGDRCVDGECETDPCAAVGCADGEFCRDGECIGVCSQACPDGEICRGGECVEDPCGGTCEGFERCVDGACVLDECDFSCPSGRICNGDICVHNICEDIRCPEGFSCQPGSGECVADELTPVAESRYGVGTGGGGCGACSVESSSNVAGLWPLAFLFLVFRRRRATRLAQRPRPGAVFLALPLVLVFLSACSVDAFCFGECEELTDAGMVDTGRPDVSIEDGCVASEEVCDETDNDCDGIVDEGFDLSSDPRNCGACEAECVLPGAFPACEAGECAIDECEIGTVDLDGNPTNGCEYECLDSGAELCDERDNDCDGSTDEGFDLETELSNCGACGRGCTFANAEASCTAGECGLTMCNVGFVDLDGDSTNGCEYRCDGDGGAEVCDGVDNNCNGMVDEGFDLGSDVSNCGACGRSCSFLNGVAACVEGVCTLDRCQAGFSDVDEDPSTGCEYVCTPTGSADTCDGVDDDCDGIVDEAEPSIGSACGSSTGACSPGVQSCQRGALVCVGGSSASGEICNGSDDDCDGRTDEGSLPGVGDRCGSTNLGRCAFGSTVCTAGSISCGGTLVGPRSETCNGVDDDCDGAVDDGLSPPAAGSVASCAEQRGVCAGRVPSCGGAAGWGCEFPEDYQSTETICDGLDNDCDGTRDEGCLSPVGVDSRLDTSFTISSRNSLRPAIAGQGSHVFSAWMTVDGRAHVYLRASNNNGSTFRSPLRVDDAGGAAFAPQLGPVGGDDVASVWADFRGGSGYREIYSDRSIDGGATLRGDVRVNASGETSTNDSYNVSLAVSGSNVYVAFEAFETNRRRQIYFSRSTNGGATWSAPVQLSTPAGTSFVAATPQVAAAGSRVYVVWRDNRNGGADIYLRRSSNSGASFSAEQRIDVGDLPGRAASVEPAITAEGDNVYVVWVDARDGGSLDIWMNRSANGGVTWRGTAQKLDQDPFPHDSFSPRVVATTPGSAVAAWVDSRSGFRDVIAIRTDDAFASFTEPQRLDTGSLPGTSDSSELSLSADGDLVAAAWSDDRGGLLDIYANYSLDGGENWQPTDVRLDTSSVGTSDSQAPAIYVGGGRVHTIWVDHRAGGGCPAPSMGSCANGDIYYRRLQ